MAWLTFTRHPHGAHPSRRRRRISVALLLGLAFTIAACGASTTGSGGPAPTPTPKPTATGAPLPCTSWRIIPSPNGTRYPVSILSAVSALSPSAAWAVGVTYGEGDTIGPVDSLIEQWDGSAWHIVASTGHDVLDGIAAISPRDMWAVGGQLNDGAGAGPLTLHWDGTAWSVVPSAQPADAKVVSLNGVAAITSQDVWAVGGQQAGPDELSQLLVEHWGGAGWQIVSSPPLPPSAAPKRGGSLSAVTRISGTNQLWAVGNWHEWTNLGRGQPLIERWDGTAWQVVASPALPTGAMGGGWSGVVALSATNAWAVGSYAIKNPVDSHPLIAHWDGTRWQIVVANPDAYGELDSVAAAGATDVRAAGSLIAGPGATSGNGQRMPLIQQWNGTAWQIATTPELPSGAISGSLSIATDAAGGYWAVGSYLNAASMYQTLILHCP
jgi:hypothetical protein